MSYGCRGVTTLIKNVRVSIPSIMSEKKIKEPMFVFESKRNGQIKACGNVNFVYATSLLFDVVGCLYPK